MPPLTTQPPLPQRYCATYIPGGQELMGRCFGIKT
jgi:hypothetical protein